MVRNIYEKDRCLAESLDTIPGCRDGADAKTVGTFGHEISHTTKQNQDWKEAGDNRAENYAVRIGEAIIKDLSEKEKR